MGTALLYPEYVVVCCQVQPNCVIGRWTSYLRKYMLRHIQSSEASVSTRYLKVNSRHPVCSVPMERVCAHTNLTTRLGCLISIVGVLLQKESTIIYAPINIVNHNIANYGQLKTQSLSFPRHLENTSPGCFSVTVPPEGATNGKGQCAAVTFPKCLIQFYQAPTNGSHVVW